MTPLVDFVFLVDVVDLVEMEVLVLVLLGFFMVVFLVAVDFAGIAVDKQDLRFGLRLGGSPPRNFRDGSFNVVPVLRGTVLINGAWVLS